MAERASEHVMDMAHELYLIKKSGLMDSNEITRLQGKRMVGESRIAESNPSFLSFINYIVFEMYTYNILKQRKELQEHNCKLLLLILNGNISKAVLQNDDLLEQIEKAEKSENENKSDTISQLKKKLNGAQKALEVNRKCAEIMLKKLKSIKLLKYIETYFNRRIIRLYKCCLNKFKTNTQVWCKYLNFLYTKQNITDLQISMVDFIKANPCNEYSWCIGILFFFCYKECIYYCRQLYFKAVQFCPNAFYIYATMFMIETSIILLMVKNYKKKQFEQEGENNDVKKKTSIQFNKGITYQEGTNESMSMKVLVDRIKGIKCKDGSEWNVTDAKEQNELVTMMHPIISKDCEDINVSLTFITNILKRICNSNIKEKGYVHLFVLLCLNFYMYTEKITCEKSLIPAVMNFVDAFSESFNKYRDEQPCIYFYRLIDVCCINASENFWECETYQKLKKDFYSMNKDGSLIIQDEEEFAKKIKPYFNYEKIKEYLNTITENLQQPGFLYLFALFIQNVFCSTKNVEPINNSGSTGFRFDTNTLTADSPIEEKSSQQDDKKIKTKNKKKTTEDDAAADDDDDDDDDEFYRQKRLVQFARNEMQCYVGEFSLDAIRKLEIFHNLDKHLFLTEGIPPLKQVNLQYLKQLDSATYTCLKHFPLMAQLCFFEGNVKIKATRYNSLYSEKLMHDKKKCVEEILYFFLIDRNIFSCFKANDDKSLGKKIISFEGITVEPSCKRSRADVDSAADYVYSELDHVNRKKMKIEEAHSCVSCFMNILFEDESECNSNAFSNQEELFKTAMEGEESEKTGHLPMSQKSVEGIDTIHGVNENADCVAKNEEVQHILTNTNANINVHDTVQGQHNQGDETLKVETTSNVSEIHQTFRYTYETVNTDTNLNNAQKCETTSANCNVHPGEIDQTSGSPNVITSEFYAASEKSETISSDYHSANESDSNNKITVEKRDKVPLEESEEKQKETKLEKKKQKEKKEKYDNGEQEHEKEKKKTNGNEGSGESPKKYFNSFIDMFSSRFKTVEDMHMKIQCLKALVNILFVIRNKYITSFYADDVSNYFYQIQHFSYKLRVYMPELKPIYEMLRTVLQDIKYKKRTT